MYKNTMFNLSTLFGKINNISAKEARERILHSDAHGIQIVDVRQPKEYERGHIPGAHLIPLKELHDRAAELSPEKPTIVY